MDQSSDLVKRLFKSSLRPQLDKEIRQNNVNLSSQIKLIEVSLAAETERQAQQKYSTLSPRKQSVIFSNASKQERFKAQKSFADNFDKPAKAQARRQTYAMQEAGDSFEVGLPQIQKLHITSEPSPIKLPYTTRAVSIPQKFATSVKQKLGRKETTSLALSKDIPEDDFFTASGPTKIAFGRGLNIREQRLQVDRAAEKRAIQLNKTRMDEIIAREIQLVAADPDEKRRLKLLESSQATEQDEEIWDGKLPALNDTTSTMEIVKPSDFNMTGLTFNLPLQEPNSGILRKKKQGSNLSRNRSNINNFKQSVPSVTIGGELSALRRNKKLTLGFESKELSQARESAYTTFFQTTKSPSFLSEKTMMDLGQKLLPKLEKKDTITYVEMRKLLRAYQVLPEDYDLHEHDPLLRQLGAIQAKREKQQGKEDSKTKGQIESMIMQLLGIEQRPQGIERITHKILNNVYDQQFEEVAGQTESVTAEFAKEIRDKKVFYDLCKSSLAPSVNATSEENHMLKYFQQCQQSNVVALPILFKIKKQRLKLENYTLNEGVCESFAKAITMLPDILHSITLAQNGLKDAQLQIILQALGQLQRVKSISIKNNEIMQESTGGLIAILDRPIPENLDELQLVSCKTNPMFTNQIVRKLQTQCNIRKLSLVQMSLTSYSDALEQILRARFLVELDISWNELKPNQLLTLSRHLAENRQLRSLNLSWNQLTTVAAPSQITAAGGAVVFNIDAKRRKMPHLKTVDEEEVTESSNKTEFETIVRPPDESLDRDSYSRLLERENNIHHQANHNREITRNICTFIKRNRSLLHLDLSETNLTEYMLWNIGSSLSRAKSLIAIHLSGNQGITPALKTMLRQRIRCKPQVSEKNKIGLDKGFNEQTREQFPNPHHKGSSMLNYTKPQAQFNPYQVVDQMKLRLYNSKKAPDVQISGYVKESNQLIFSRKLGHKAEMPGSGQWRMFSDGDERCWCCDRHIYTLVFWSLEHGWNEVNSINPFQEENIVQQIERANNDFKGVTWDGPMFFTAENNWQPQRLVTIEEFLYRIDSKAPNYFKEMRHAEAFRPEVTSERDLNPSERQKLQASIQLFQNRNYTSSDQLKRVLFQELRYRQPEMINPELMMEKDLTGLNEDEKKLKQVYCFPSFWKQGKHIIVVAFPDEQNQLEYFTHRIIVRQREEDIPLFTKKLRIKSTQRKFNKNSSAFKDWQEDTNEILAQVIDHDSKLWKVERFVKDANDLPKIIAILKQYAGPIKNAYIQVSCRSVYPGISSVDFFAQFSRKAQICSDAESSLSDRTFIAVKNQPVPMEGKDPTTICRYEFIESIVRFADQQFFQTGVCESISESLQRTIEEKILKHFPYDGWQEFRDEFVWTLPMSDVFNANREGVQKLMTSRFTARKQYVTLKDILQMICRDSGLNIGEPEVKYCYGMSKMTLVNEKGGYKQYQTIKETEFMEFLVRLAHYKFSTWAQPINVKLELLLDELFKLIGYKRVPVKVDIEEMSESDDDY